MKFTATAEHCSGKSIDHPCTKGIWSDPTDSFQVEIEATDLDAARMAADDALDAEVDPELECDCRRKLWAGSNDWWSSVAIHLWPLDAEAAAALDAEDFTDWREDPFGLVPDGLKHPVVITHERYGETTSFASVEDAQQVIRACGGDFANTTLRIDGAWIRDDRGDIVGTYTGEIVHPMDVIAKHQGR